MRPLIKKLPATRAEYSFGDLVYWHFFKFGTRPDVDPAAKIGRPWRREDAIRALKVTDRTLRNWINDSNPPKDIVRLDEVLFGQNPLWADARLELQQAFERTSAAPSIVAQPDEPEPDDVAPDQDALVAAGDDLVSEPLADAPSVPVEPEQAEPEQPNVTEHSDEEHAPSRAPLPAGGPSKTQPRRKAPALVAGVVVLFGLYAWSQTSREPEKKIAANPGTVTSPARAPAPPPAPPPAPIRTAAPQPSPPPQPAPLPSRTAPAPDEPIAKPPPFKIEPPAAQPPREPTEAEKQLAEQKRLAEKLVAARQAAFDAQQKELEDEARRRDAQSAAKIDEARERQDEARSLAGLGFRLTENQSIPGTSFSHVQVETVADCALACTRDRCDAFGFYRMQYPRGARAKRYCYLYRKPFAEPANYPGYVLGEPTSPPSQRSEVPQAQIILAQATAPATSDEVTRCSSGPVKVTGFALNCDEILGGGTAPGGQERYAVATINDCAARCRPNKSCTGFTFNTGDPEGRRACQLFGGRPEGRESPGWVSGRR